MRNSLRKLNQTIIKRKENPRRLEPRNEIYFLDKTRKKILFIVGGFILICIIAAVTSAPAPQPPGQDLTGQQTIMQKPIELKSSKPIIINQNNNSNANLEILKK